MPFTIIPVPESAASYVGYVIVTVCGRVLLSRDFCGIAVTKLGPNAFWKVPTPMMYSNTSCNNENCVNTVPSKVHACVNVCKYTLYTHSYVQVLVPCEDAVTKGNKWWCSGAPSIEKYSAFIAS